MKNALTLLTVALAAFSIPSHAQWYAGGSIGQTKGSLSAGGQNDQLIGLGFDDASTSFDDKDTSYRVYGGYRFHRNFAAEIAYVDLGRFELRSTVVPAGTLTNRIRSSGAELSVLGLLPLGDRWTVFGRVGVLAARTKASYSGDGSVFVNEGEGEQSQRSSGLVYGIGAMVDLTPRFGLRAEWNEFRKLGDELTGGEFDTRVVSAGLQYRF